MREYVRTTVAAAAVAAALVLTGCSGDNGADAGGDKGKDTGANGTSGGSAGQSSTPPGADQGTSADVAGSWLATTDGKIIALIIQGSDAAVAGEHVCSGTVAEGDKVTLRLKCADGDADRTTGVVTPGAGGDSITVKWGSGIKDTFRKSAAGDKLPEGIPSDLPKLPGS
ncbi:hypothetical protein [Streptomyces chryseus]|uniref:Lipoprotein n=1 Tax=Streptomyces chryseus TaxID=68186 RepID=A0ABQ3DSI4_9ACTN|nr:hypothetical protein [Streptomyces chryseus]GGX28306.1 hypothetical protein GCM10010353_49310 [Streptomyces chryseus]GHB10684.1 hypothetical protein GCM10010346_37380 [Streptomyces chryseus]